MCLIKEISRSLGTRSFILLAGRCTFQVLLHVPVGRRPSRMRHCIIQELIRKVYSEVKQTLYVKSMRYFSTAKFESRKECTAFIEITLVSEGMQVEHKHSTKEFHLWSCSVFVRVCLFFGCSKQTMIFAVELQFLLVFS